MGHVWSYMIDGRRTDLMVSDRCLWLSMRQHQWSHDSVRCKLFNSLCFANPSLGIVGFQGEHIILIGALLTRNQ